MNIIHDLPPYIYNKNQFVSVDVEMFQMNGKQLHRPTSGRFACLTVCPNDEDVYIITDPELVTPTLERIQDSVWVTQNGKFDFVQLRRWAKLPPRKLWWDTLYIEKIMYGGYYDSFGLEDLARRVLNIELDKSGQKYFEKANELNEDSIHYACLDSLVTRQIAIIQNKKIDKDSFKIWTDIDRPFTWAVMDFSGFPINPILISQLAEENQKAADELGTTLPFNFKSPKQVLTWAKERGIKISSTDEETLTNFIIKYPDKEESEIFTKVLSARGYSKMASTYGMNLIEEYMEYETFGDQQYPVIYPNINPNQAETGRTSSTDPNIQNQPNEKRFRACYEAAPGFDMPIADYVAQEPCITAYVTQDEKLIQIFKDHKDIYIEMYTEMFGEKLSSKKDPRRKPMKDIFLGMTYGLTKWGFSKKQGIPIDEAEFLLTKSMNTFPRVKEWQKEQFSKKQFVTTVSGRRAYINPYSYQANNNKLNSPIQGTAADMIKKSIAQMHQTWPFSPYRFAVCAPIHDEVVAHAPKEISKDVVVFIKNTMEQVAEEMCPGIPFVADVVLGKSWADKL